MAEAEFETNSSVRGYQVYQDNWTPVIGERLNCEREEENSRDRYAVAIRKSGDTVGHVQCSISTFCSVFIRRGGTIFCVVTGRRRYSMDLPQGGMEIPCKYRFVGNGREIKKVRSYITKPVTRLPSSRDEDKIGQSSSNEKPQPSSQPLTPRTPARTDVSVGVTRVNNSSDLTSKTDNTESSTNNYTGLISTNSNKTSSSNVTSYDRLTGRENSPLASIQGTNVLSDISNHTSDTSITMTDKKVVCSTDSISTELLSRSDCVTDQSSKNSKKVFLCDKTLVEEIFSDDDSCPEQCHGNLTLWITFDRHILQMTDKAALEHGEELSDRHIQMAQSIMKKQFLLIKGLRNTLLQGQIVIGCTVNTIQIVHCNKRKHWVTVTTKWCQRNKVSVYDTLFDKLDFETKGVMKKMFALKKAGDINMVPVQKQQGSKDCGVFAIAIMASLAFDENPSCVTYRQNHLRTHLLDCFTNRRFTPFPKDQNER